MDPLETTPPLPAMRTWLARCRVMLRRMRLVGHGSGRFGWVAGNRTIWVRIGHGRADARIDRAGSLARSAAGAQGPPAALGPGGRSGGVGGPPAKRGHGSPRSARAREL